MAGSRKGSHYASRFLTGGGNLKYVNHDRSSHGVGRCDLERSNVASSKHWDPPLPPILQRLPRILKDLSRHPERGQWKAAALVRTSSWRWPLWPLELGLAAVDSRLEAHVVQFIVQPPHGWTEKSEVELPSHLCVDRVFEEGLTATQAVVLLNEVLADMRVVNNAAFGDSIEYRLQKAGGVRPTWACPIWGWNSSSVRVNIGEHASVEFDARLPSDGDLKDRLWAWAEGYMTAQHALHLFTTALTHPELLSDAM